MAVNLDAEQLSKVGKTLKKHIKVEDGSIADKIFSFLENVPEAIKDVKDILETAKEIKNPTPKKIEYSRPTKTEELQGFDKTETDTPTSKQIDTLNLDVRIDNALTDIFNKAETQKTSLMNMSGYQLVQHFKIKREDIKKTLIQEIIK